MTLAWSDCNPFWIFGYGKKNKKAQISQQIPAADEEGTEHGTSTDGDQIINVEEETGADATRHEEGVVTDQTKGSKTFDILKSIVYGGLKGSIGSLRVLSSAVAADATTLNIVALVFANLIGGLLKIGYNLWELKNELKNEDVKADRYQELLGQPENFSLHATGAVLSFLVFGLIPPVTYGFPFSKSDIKLVVAAAASLLCVIILAFGKAHMQRPPKFYMHFKTVCKAILVLGVSYSARYLIKRLIEKLGWFESSIDVTLSLPEMRSVNPAWGSY